MKIVILAAGIGSRLGSPLPKPLTLLKNGKSILQHQVDNLSTSFSVHDINVVVGFKKDLIMEAFPDLTYIYNQNFDQTNTSQSLLKALKKYQDQGVLWLNGDVVFDSKIIKKITSYIHQNKSFVCVNREKVGDEEVKYTVDDKGNIMELSKTVKNALGEAIGINYIASHDIKAFIRFLEVCHAGDYFERGLELAILNEGIEIEPVDISEFDCMEIDFQDDLNKANSFIK
ncbi:MAG: phosphocholine cytidylyltransferase family protein [Proteobacteria bacterium]|nr:phosphocholine cytidylyltransferase family protein [Pseudomonadota bacterium]